MTHKQKPGVWKARVLGGPLEDERRRRVWVVSITRDGDGKLYWVRRLEGTPEGLGLEVEQLGPARRETYQVFVGAAGPHEDLCTCLGFHHHKKPCRHLRALRALAAAGKIGASE
jgi:hypothetical protein